jgi:hypothetical protein
MFTLGIGTISLIRGFFRAPNRTSQLGKVRKRVRHSQHVQICNVPHSTNPELILGDPELTIDYELDHSDGVRIVGTQRWTKDRGWVLGFAGAGRAWPNAPWRMTSLPLRSSLKRLVTPPKVRFLGQSPFFNVHAGPR